MTFRRSQSRLPALDDAQAMEKPVLGVLYGQPDYISTSFQTSQLAACLRNWFHILPLRVKSRHGNKMSLSWNRVLSNYLVPVFRQPKVDYLLYANDGIADLGFWKGRKILYWYDAASDWSIRPPWPFQWAAHLRYRNVLSADYVFAVSQMQEEMARRMRPGKRDTVVYLPVGVDCRFFDPQSANPGMIRERFHLPPKTIVGYLGYLRSLGDRFSGEPLVEVAPQLLRKADVHFLVVGFGPALPSFRKKVDVAGLTKHFTFTDYLPNEWLPSSIAAMDICVDTLEEGFHSHARSETKLKQYMAMGRACVATALGENRVDLDHGNCGVLAEPGDGPLLDALAYLCSHPERWRELGAAARKRAVESYDWLHIAERMAGALGLAK